MYKTKLINLVIADALQLDSLRDSQDYIASLLIQGVSSLCDMTIAELDAEVWCRYQHTFNDKLSDKLSTDDEAFKDWVLAQQVREYLHG